MHTQFLNCLFLSGSLDVIQTIPIKRSVALDVSFHAVGTDGSIILALALDSGSVSLFSFSKNEPNAFSEACVLSKHEDWVRCISFITLGENLQFRND